jgi:sugar phosphate isomerase/epimerase
MMQVGIFNGYFPYTLKEQAEKIKAIGFNTVQLDLAFKDIDFSTPESITKEKAKTVRETFRDHNLPICTISCYTNIVHPDPGERKRRLDYLKAVIRNARNFGTPYVISETGTFDTDSDWVHHPQEQNRRGVRRVPESDRGTRPDGLRSRCGIFARNLCEQCGRFG